MQFESKRGPKGKKNMFYKLESFFFSFFLFFHYSSSFAIQKWFLELEEVLP
jgi:hypothetical protein